MVLLESMTVLGTEGSLSRRINSIVLHNSVCSIFPMSELW